MGRHSRKLHVRLLRVGAAAAVCGFAYRRWHLRASSALPVSAYRPASEISDDGDGPAPRSSRWAALQRSSAADPFDLLVVGGGLTGLYTAVDAAQRGLRVALVDAADFGGGSSTSCMPHLSPGALPYVQRAIRQRDPGWLRIALAVLTEETIWANVAPWCVDAPDTLRQRWRDWWRRGVSAESATRSGVAEGDTAILSRVGELSSQSPFLFSGGAPLPTTTLLPALHSSEMVEYFSAAIVGTVMSIFCGSLRPNAVLPRFAIEKRLPALASTSASPSSSTSSLQLRGGVIANDFALRGNTAAVSLARTAEELGVVVLSYAPVCAIREAFTSITTDPNLLCDLRCSSPCGGVMLVSVRDALASEAPAACSSVPPTPVRSLSSIWWPWTCGTSSLTSGDGAGISPREEALPTSNTPATTRVFARSVVNCTGCWTDTVKAMYEGNSRDTVPAVFAGYQVYSYLIAPADAVRAASPPQTASMEGHGARQEAEGRAPPPSRTFFGALVLSSPRLSFASVAVMPWWDQCVMLGPNISSLPQFPGAASADTNTMLRSVDGYAAQRRHTLSMLSSSGVTVDASRLLSCVSQIVPYVKGPRAVPWAGELLHRGYAFQFTSLPLSEDIGREDGVTAPSLQRHPADSQHHVVDAARRDVPLLHVYGGAPVMARRIAEEAVDTLVRHEPPIFPQGTRSRILPCRTRYLRLRTPASLCTSSNSGPVSAEARLEALVKETYAERLVDVVARRTHVAYTSPMEALQALPTLADVMGGVLQWTEGRRQAEIAVARHLVTSVAVPV